jgi:hypothetical protein
MYSFLTAFLRRLCRIARAYGNGSSVHALSFFFTKLKDEGPAAVAKWTNNVDVFSMDIGDREDYEKAIHEFKNSQTSYDNISK